MALDTTDVRQEGGAGYVVKPGDNLSKIAKQFGFDSYQDLVRLNADKYPELLSNPDRIFPGMELKTAEAVAPQEPEITTASPQTNLETSGIAQTHTVEPG